MAAYGGTHGQARSLVNRRGGGLLKTGGDLLSCVMLHEQWFLSVNVLRTRFQWAQQRVGLQMNILMTFMISAAQLFVLGRC